MRENNQKYLFIYLYNLVMPDEVCKTLKFSTLILAKDFISLR